MRFNGLLVRVSINKPFVNQLSIKNNILDIEQQWSRVRLFYRLIIFDESIQSKGKGKKTRGHQIMR